MFLAGGEGKMITHLWGAVYEVDPKFCWLFADISGLPFKVFLFDFFKTCHSTALYKTIVQHEHFPVIYMVIIYIVPVLRKI